MSKRIFISSGHDSGDPGAVKYVCERDEVWDIANRVKKVLNRDYECEVYRDYWDWGWRQTVDNCNKNKCEYFFEFHENAGGGDGAECIIHNNSNQWMADEIKKAFLEIGQEWRRTIVDPAYWVLKYTNCPAMIVECAFVDNKKDIQDWDEPEERQKMAESLAKHIAIIAKLEKKPQPKPEPKPQPKGEWSEEWVYKEDGKIVKGWREIDGKTYYFEPLMAKGWKKIDLFWYYFHKTGGNMMTGWQKIDGKTYYFHKTGGNMMINWQTIDGKTYYFYEDGHLAMDETIDGLYYVNEDGVWEH